jgi:hypothetical protein
MRPLKVDGSGLWISRTVDEALLLPGRFTFCAAFPLGPLFLLAETFVFRVAFFAVGFFLPVAFFPGLRFFLTMTELYHAEYEDVVR